MQLHRHVLIQFKSTSINSNISKMEQITNQNYINITNALDITINSSSVSFVNQNIVVTSDAKMLIIFRSVPMSNLLVFIKRNDKIIHVDKREWYSTFCLYANDTINFYMSAHDATPQVYKTAILLSTII